MELKLPVIDLKSKTSKVLNGSLLLRILGSEDPWVSLCTFFSSIMASIKYYTYNNMYVGQSHVMVKSNKN